jgi:hypothetical protein
MVSDEEGEDKMATVGPIARGALELRKKGKDPMYILYLFIYLFILQPPTLAAMDRCMCRRPPLWSTLISYIYSLSLANTFVAFTVQLAFPTA